MNKKHGISLIVLVITIIVMIILASAVILSLSNSGIIDRADEAVDKTNQSEIQQLATLGWLEAYADGKRTKPELELAVNQYLLANGLKESMLNNYVVKVTDKGVNVYYVPADWKASVELTTADGVPIPKGFAASPYAGEKTKAGGLVIYELTEDEIQKGITELPNEEQYTSLTERNQYVWVPVDNFSKFVRKNFMSSDPTASISNTLGSKYWEVVLNTKTNMPLADQGDDYAFVPEDTLEEAKKMYASVEKYGGFYIARYEAGENGTGFKMHNEPDRLLVSNKSVELARATYSLENTSYGAVSTLTYGVQWDAVLQWWLDTKAVADVTKSKDYGNYRDSTLDIEDFNEGAYYREDTGSAGDDPNYYPVTTRKESGKKWILKTGALKTAKIRNIYDMAGNMEEVTMERQGTKGYEVARGGKYSFEGDLGSPGYHHPVSYRVSTSSPGYRISLYIE